MRQARNTGVSTRRAFDVKFSPASILALDDPDVETSAVKHERTQGLVAFIHRNFVFGLIGLYRPVASRASASAAFPRPTFVRTRVRRQLSRIHPLPDGPVKNGTLVFHDGDLSIARARFGVSRSPTLIDTRIALTTCGHGRRVASLPRSLL